MDGWKYGEKEKHYKHEISDHEWPKASYFMHEILQEINADKSASAIVRRALKKLNWKLDGKHWYSPFDDDDVEYYKDEIKFFETPYTLTEIEDELAADNRGAVLEALRQLGWAKTDNIWYPPGQSLTERIEAESWTEKHYGMIEICEVLMIEPTMRTMMAVGKVLRGLGWNRRKTRVNGKRQMRWHRGSH